jgi:hypothetical protein
LAWLLQFGVPDATERKARWPLVTIERVGSLEIDQDLAFERREWAVQRLGWVIVLLMLVAGLAGLLGPGALSRVETSAGPLTIAYERFVRKRAPTELHVTLGPGAAANGVAAIWFDQAYLSKIAIEHVVPEPLETEAAADGLIFRFSLANPEHASEIVFDVEPAEPGASRGRVGLVDGSDVVVDQFIYP